MAIVNILPVLLLFFCLQTAKFDKKFLLRTFNTQAELINIYINITIINIFRTNELIVQLPLLILIFNLFVIWTSNLFKNRKLCSPFSLFSFLFLKRLWEHYESSATFRRTHRTPAAEKRKAVTSGRRHRRRITAVVSMQ